MAEPLSTIALALKAAAKALLKKMSHKAIKKAVVKGVKKKAKSKIKDKLLGKKKDKRRIAKNIMQEQGEWVGGGALVVTPTTALIPKEPDTGGALAVIDKSGEGGAPLDFKKMGQQIDNIVEMTDAIAMLTGVEKKQAKDQAQARQIAKAKAEKRARESKLESKKAEGKAIGIVKKPAQGLLDMMMKFLINVTLGTIILQIVTLVKNAKKVWEGLKKGFQDFFWIWRTLLWKGFIPKKLLQGVGASIKLLGGLIKGFVSKTLAPFKAVGTTIFNAFKGAANGIKGFIGGIATKIGDVINAVKNGAINMVKNAFPGLVQWADNAVQTVGRGIQGIVQTGSNILTGAKNWITGGISRLTGGANAATGGVMRRGLGRSVGRMGLKVFGRGGVRAIGGIMSKAKAIFGRIPLIGPLMVAVSGMLEDPPQPVGQIAFRAFGTALGGLLGGMIGAVGGPLAIVGAILGEMVGEFVGDLMYSLFFGGGISEVKDKFVAKMKQIWDMVTGVGEWIGKGFKRFTEGLLTKHPIEIESGWGRRSAATKIAEILGLKDWLKGLGYVEGDQVVKFPNLLQLFNPFESIPLAIDSFFGSDESTDTPPAEVTPGSENFDVTTEEGTTTAQTDTTTSGSSSANLGQTESQAGANANAVSSEASYEGQQGGGNSIMLGGSGGSGGGSAGGGGGAKVVVLGSKDTLNNYIKAMNTKSLSAV